MNWMEAFTFGYIVLSVTGFTVIMGYMAFCGIRQYVDDARTGATYRTEDEKFREAMKRQ